MLILDLSAGRRATWFVKQHDVVIHIDNQAEVKPDVVCSSLMLPFRDHTFNFVVFDPPHVNLGGASKMAKRYSHMTTEDIRFLVLGTAQEARRVSKPNSLMAFKWNDHDTPLAKIFIFLEGFWEPLFGHSVSIRTRHSSNTYWAMLLRRD